MLPLPFSNNHIDPFLVYDVVHEGSVIVKGLEKIVGEKE